MYAERNTLKTGTHKFHAVPVSIEKVGAGMRLAGSIAVPDEAHYSVSYSAHGATQGRKFPATEAGRREAWKYYENQVRETRA